MNLKEITKELSAKILCDTTTSSPKSGRVEWDGRKSPFRERTRKAQADKLL